MFNRLNAEQKDEFHEKLLKLCLAYSDQSLALVNEKCADWTASLNAYEAQAPGRVRDQDASEQERPTSQSIPMTYSQIQTFKAFAASVLGQRTKQFEFAPGGPEDSDITDLIEDAIEQDLSRESWKTKRGQWLQMFGLFGIGIFASEWKEDKIGVTFETDDADSSSVAFGQTFSTKKVVTQEVTRYKGNKVTTVSPFRYLPDPSFDMCDQRKARFQGHEFEMSFEELKGMEVQKQVAGVDQVPKMFAGDRWARRGWSNDKPTYAGARYDQYRHSVNNRVCVITQLQLRIIPAGFSFDSCTNEDDKYPLGKSTAPIILTVWLANDSRIIKCERSGYLHGGFNYDVAVIDNEKHKMLGKSIAEIMSKLQETIDWFLNSRVEAVTRNIQPQLIYDPQAIDKGDLYLNERFIRLKKGMGRMGIDSFVKQLQVSDPTVRHMDDINQIKMLIYETTGININMTGQFNTGRRSATEARVVSGGSASRVVGILEEAWESCFSPLGSKFACNLRQGLSMEDMLRRFGDRMNNHEKPDLFIKFKSDPVHLATAIDTWVLDATTPSEKGFQAQWITEIFTAVVANPVTALQLDISPRLLLEKAIELQGIPFRDDIRLSKDPQTLQQIVMQMAQQLAAQMLAQQTAQADASATNEPASQA